MNHGIDPEEMMEALRECIIALQVAETNEERGIIRSQIHRLKQHITSRGMTVPFGELA
ncbi:hypothetical protein [Paenibacillus abyssi]|uniref:Uncharacterized protein n=1 Tax=Paenibacillus abyssi TaxID=1340531 RepID=A0A917G1F4_9BACL|nr:hypothetical protein [Paenibacillus abyssi]GGG17545.1 hypothetical protein GCM10010916_37970 [Paenibacillus abyssi]